MTVNNLLSSSLRQLTQFIKDDYDEECKIEKRKVGKFVPIVKLEAKLKGMDGPNTPSKTEYSRWKLLASWQGLVSALNDRQVFLEQMERLTDCYEGQADIPESSYGHMCSLVDHMTVTVVNADEPDTEIRYRTLLEVARSYHPRWAMSRSLHTVWGRTPSSSSAVPFRREAYLVLMSLRWTTSSAGSLYFACSGEPFDFRPPSSHPIFDHVGDLLPRYDNVISVYELCKEHKTVAICSPNEGAEDDSGGSGKTSLAALVACYPKLQRDHLVVWLSLQALTYETYCQQLDVILQTVKIRYSWPSLQDNDCHLETMARAKKVMVKFLKGTKLFLILDNVENEEDLEWFRFSKEHNVLATTERHQLKGAKMFAMETIRQDDLMRLFLEEAGYPSNTVLMECGEARSIVSLCKCHPLTVRTAARWLRMKKVTAGIVHGLHELSMEIESCLATLRHGHFSQFDLLVEMLHIVLSPMSRKQEGNPPSQLLKICFSSLAIFDGPVPLEVANILWREIMKAEPAAKRETKRNVKNYVRIVSEALLHLGLIIATSKNGTPFIEVSHKMFSDYCIVVASEMDPSQDPNGSLRLWNKLFVNGFTEAKKEEFGIVGKCHVYMLQRLGQHMLAADMFREVEDLLTNHPFVHNRLDVLGLQEGASVLLKDCRDLRLMRDAEMQENRGVATRILKDFAALLVFDVDDKDREKATAVAKILHSIGKSLHQIRSHPDAILQYKAALKLSPPKITSAAIHYDMAASLLHRDEPEKASKRLKTCFKIMNEVNSPTPLYENALLLKGEISEHMCNYREAFRYFDDAIDQMRKNLSECRRSYGSALLRKGRLCYTLGDTERAVSLWRECSEWNINSKECSATVAAAYVYLGDIYLAQGQNLEASTNYNQASNLLESLSETEDIDLHLLTAKLGLTLGDADGCREMLSEVREMISRSPMLGFDRTPYDLRVIARMYWALNEPAEAVYVLEECIRKTQDRPMSLERASTLFAHGNYLVNSNGDPKKALSSMKEALKIRCTQYGEENEITIATSTRIDDVLRTLG